MHELNIILILTDKVIMKIFTIIFLLGTLTSCQEKFSADPVTPEPEVANEQPATEVYRNTLEEWLGSFEPNQSLRSYYGKGNCSIDPDNFDIIYEKTELSYTGLDYCQMPGEEIYNPEGICSISYKIDFSEEEPQLLVLYPNCR